MNKQLSTTDARLYELLRQAQELKIPFVFCGDDAGKWELIALLNQTIKGVQASIGLDPDGAA